MTSLISYPFRLTNNGAVQTVEEGTEDHYAEELAMLILTKPGERELVPGYGLDDPTFDDVDETELAVAVKLYGPPINITDLDVDDVDASTQNVIVSFSIQGSGSEDNNNGD